MTKKQNIVSNESANDEAGQDRFLVPFTLEQFRKDILSLYLLHVNLIRSIANQEATLRFLDKSSTEVYIEFEDAAAVAAELDFTYVDIQHSDLARSLESMYRYAYHGELDHTVEELGPGGYHIAIAAIVKDMAESSFMKFCFWSDVDRENTVKGIKDSVENCLRTVELANARLTLEGQARFFNFDGKDEDFDNLIGGGTTDMPQGGYGAALTIRQLALLSGMGEMSIRTLANPKRANQIPTENRSGRTLVSIDAAKAWLKDRGRYVPIRRGMDGATNELMIRRFFSTKDLFSTVIARLTAFYDTTRLTMFQELGDRFGVTTEDKTAYGNPEFLRELADILDFPPQLFALRVKEALLNDELAAVRRQAQEEIQKSQ